MAEKKKVSKDDLSWDEIGSVIGEKIGVKMEEAFKEEECKGWKKPWFYHKHDGGGGGFGRFIFIMGTLYAMSLSGMLAGIPLWVLAIIVIGFTFMRL